MWITTKTGESLCWRGWNMYCMCSYSQCNVFKWRGLLALNIILHVKRQVFFLMIKSKRNILNNDYIDTHTAYSLRYKKHFNNWWEVKLLVNCVHWSTAETWRTAHLRQVHMCRRQRGTVGTRCCLGCFGLRWDRHTQREKRKRGTWIKHALIRNPWDGDINI